MHQHGPVYVTFFPVGTFRKLHNIFSFAFLYTKTLVLGRLISQKQSCDDSVLSYNHHRILFCNSRSSLLSFGGLHLYFGSQAIPFFCFVCLAKVFLSQQIGCNWKSNTDQAHCMYSSSLLTVRSRLSKHGFIAGFTRHVPEITQVIILYEFLPYIVHS